MLDFSALQIVLFLFEPQGGPLTPTQFLTHSRFFYGCQLTSWHLFVLWVVKMDIRRASRSDCLWYTKAMDPEIRDYLTDNPGVLGVFLSYIHNLRICLCSLVSVNVIPWAVTKSQNRIQSGNGRTWQDLGEPPFWISKWTLYFFFSFFFKTVDFKVTQ